MFWIPGKHLDKVVGRMVPIRAYCNMCKNKANIIYDPGSGGRDPYYFRFVGVDEWSSFDCDSHEVDLFKITDEDHCDRNQLTFLLILDKLNVNDYRGKTRHESS